MFGCIDVRSLGRSIPARSTSDGSADIDGHNNNIKHDNGNDNNSDHNINIVYAARRPADPVYLYPSDLVRSRMKDGFPLQGASCAPEGR